MRPSGNIARNAVLCAAGLVVAGPGMLSGCFRERTNHRAVSPRGDTISVWAEFVYLPQADRMVATLTPESTVVERRNSRDSLVQMTRTANTPHARALFDSALGYIRKIAPGTYRREHVIDGTRISLRHRNRVILCDNCLHEFVLQAAGAPSGSTPRSAELIRGAVRHINSMVMIAEGKSTRNLRVLSVTIDKTRMRDTGKSYEVNNAKAEAY